MDWLPVFSEARLRELCGDEAVAALPADQSDRGEYLYRKAVRSSVVVYWHGHIELLGMAVSVTAQDDPRRPLYLMMLGAAILRMPGKTNIENLDQAAQALELALRTAEEGAVRRKTLQHLRHVAELRDKAKAPARPHFDDSDTVHFPPPTLPFWPSKPVDPQPQTQQAEIASSLGTENTKQLFEVLENEVLGHGSNGTTVYGGRMGGEDVAVKRMLAHYKIATASEVDILRRLRSHPNVVRYYFHLKEEHFQFIVLERCQTSLAKEVATLPVADLRQMLQQMALGLNHLHANGVVHRDLKPSNVLLCDMQYRPLRLVLSDFGISKTLEPDQSSLTATYAAGTIGWRAPELLSVHDASTDAAGAVRAGKKNDIFSMGLVFYFVLTRGQHPFSRGKNDMYMRELNIRHGTYNLDGLDATTDNDNNQNYNTVEARHLIEWMLCADPAQRPTIEKVLMHPFFWDARAHLDFLCDASDDLKPKHRLVPLPQALVELEAMRDRVFVGNFLDELPGPVRSHMTKNYKYNGTKLQQLLRLVRNICHHYEEQPQAVQQDLGAMPSGLLQFWNSRFPQLFMSCWSLSGWENIDRFERYFKLKGGAAGI